MAIAQKYFTLANPPVKAVDLDLQSPTSTFKLNNGSLDPSKLDEDKLLVKTIYLSNDPTQRAWIQKGVDPKRMYVPPVLEGDVMKSIGLVKVVLVGSKVSGYKVGDYATGWISWSDYSVISPALIWNKIEDPNVLPLTMYLDIIGLTGLTAYFGLKEIGQFKEGQSIIISAASGATGSLAIQIAKHVFKASKIIAITGSDDKCEFVKTLGADIAINYRNPAFLDLLEEALGEDYVDCYFDLVGGQILDTCLKLIKPYGRVIACGAISGYNDKELMKVLNYSEIITNKLTVQGFIVGDFGAQFPEAVKILVENIKNGNIKTDNSTLSIQDASDDFSKIPLFWNYLFTDEKPNGKLLTKVSDA